MRYIVCALLAGILLLTFNTPSAAQTGITIRQLLQTTTTPTGQPLEFPHFRNQVTAVLTELAPGGQTGSGRVSSVGDITGIMQPSRQLSPLTAV